ncbi:hypothetical protein K505DRAFT_26595 [Melanomma pulvis-pyrius CBS 109.77]|uniref:Uncharacterized protein n=1 Tax=Melanomma pulvis-pyrius CBS 109.77 TaxID=1314802 RepID=A0A6A6XFD7_9PLEO|nr:hypothetical protein K505DRAFT_26595 [Melanomma pulvis-pyrius CBS 109.77]
MRTGIGSRLLHLKFAKAASSRTIGSGAFSLSLVPPNTSGADEPSNTHSAVHLPSIDIVLWYRPSLSRFISRLVFAMKTSISSVLFDWRSSLVSHGSYISPAIYGGVY